MTVVGEIILGLGGAFLFMCIVWEMEKLMPGPMERRMARHAILRRWECSDRQTKRNQEYREKRDKMEIEGKVHELKTRLEISRVEREIELEEKKKRLSEIRNSNT